MKVVSLWAAKKVGLKTSGRIKKGTMVEKTYRRRYIEVKENQCYKQNRK